MLKACMLKTRFMSTCYHMLTSKLMCVGSIDRCMIELRRPANGAGHQTYTCLQACQHLSVGSEDVLLAWPVCC